MKPLKLALILFTYLISFTTFSQIKSNSIIEECATPINLEDYNRQKSFQRNNNFIINSNARLGINIKVHFVRRTNGSGALYNQSNLNNLKIGLINSFKDLNISFKIIGYTYINNGSYYDYFISDPNNVSLFDVNNDPNAVNLYVVNSARNSGQFLGLAAGIPSNAFLVTYSSLFSGTTKHEIGHCLNLYHTFQGTDNKSEWCAELVPSVLPNCEDCGDLVCDTPADANTGRTGIYNPDINNFMSYYRDTRNRFTEGQKQRMFQTIFDENILGRTINLDANLKSNKTLPCRGDGVTVSYDINELPTGLSFSHWELSINAGPIWRNNTSITFYLPSNSPYPTDVVNVTGYFIDRFNNVIRASISVEFLHRSSPTPYNVATYSTTPTSGYSAFSGSTFCTGVNSGQYIYVRFNRRLRDISLNKSSGNSTVVAGNRVIDGYDYMIYIPTQNQYNFFSMTGTDICSGDIKSTNECIWLPRRSFILSHIKGDEVQIELDLKSSIQNNFTLSNNSNDEFISNFNLEAFNQYGKKIHLTNLHFNSNHIIFNTAYSGLIILKIIEPNKSIETIKFFK